MHFSEDTPRGFIASSWGPGTNCSAGSRTVPRLAGDSFARSGDHVASQRLLRRGHRRRGRIRRRMGRAPARPARAASGSARRAQASFAALRRTPRRTDGDPPTRWRRARGCPTRREQHRCGNVAVPQGCSQLILQTSPAPGPPPAVVRSRRAPWANGPRRRPTDASAVRSPGEPRRDRRERVRRRSRAGAAGLPGRPEHGGRRDRAPAVTRAGPGTACAGRAARRCRSACPIVPPTSPASFAVDPFVPLRLPRVDAWFGFNRSRAGAASSSAASADAEVVLWSVHFVPDRFGAGTPLTTLYHRDRLCCTLRTLAWNSRRRLARPATAATGSTAAVRPPVVPMGAWLDRIPAVA